MASPKASVKEANVCGRFVVFHTKFDSVPLFDIFLHCKRNEVRKHNHTQTAVTHDWLNQSSWNKYGHTAKVTTNVPIYMNEVLHCQFVHRKISTLTFGTNHLAWPFCSLHILIFLCFDRLLNLSLQPGTKGLESVSDLRPGWWTTWLPAHAVAVLQLLLFNTALI